MTGSLKPLICVSVMGRDEAELEEKIERALSLGGDLVELRLDFLRELNASRLEDLISSFADRIVITLRPSWEGGRYGEGEQRRIEMLRRLSESRPAYVDLELRTGSIVEVSAELRRRSKLIISSHDFSGTPSEDELTSRALESLRYGDLVKIVPTSRSMDDNLRILGLYRRGDLPAERLIAFAMGEAGAVTRILAPMLGSPIAYACLPGEEVAPGQLNITHFKRILDLVMPR
ncbi:MAG: type I 3-dehydroquinate dehydratase [Nitrososphaerota archaeon]